MALQLACMEEFDRRLLRVVDLLQSEFDLSDRELDIIVYNSSFENDLRILCGDPDYANYN